MYQKTPSMALMTVISGDPPLGKSEEAIAVYQKILEINPNVAVAYCNLGCIWQMQGKV
jgi:tetratricopeptide (TPR) repeat protein